MKRQILLLILFFASTGVWSQVSLNGTITDYTKKPVSGASVQLFGSSARMNTITNAQAILTFANLQPGRFTITVSYVGFETFVEELALDSAFAEKNYTVQLIGGSKQLQNVEVIGRSAKSYNSQYSFGATKNGYSQ